jgi:hypothetical protein
LYRAAAICHFDDSPASRIITEKSRMALQLPNDDLNNGRVVARPK